MASEAQIAANRANAARSTGPRTARGKARSSRNAFKHGTFARKYGAFAATLLADDSKADLVELRESYIASFQPANARQTFLVAQMALADWRLQRLSALEAHIVDSHHEAALRDAGGAHESNLSLHAILLPDAPAPPPRPQRQGPPRNRFAEAYIRDSERGDAFSKLSRAQNSNERSYYRALHQLRSEVAAAAPQSAQPPSPRTGSVVPTKSEFSGPSQPPAEDNKRETAPPALQNLAWSPAASAPLHGPPPQPAGPAVTSVTLAPMDLAAIQEQLRALRLDGWLFFDHHRRDPLAYRILGFQPAGHITRRWYYFIPAQGEPVGLVHRVEPGMLAALPGDRIPYSRWSEQTTGLAKLLHGCRRVAMQFSPLCAIPYISLVDGGTIDLVRAAGVEVVSSAELIQHFEARLDQAGYDSHIEAGRRVDAIRAAAFQLIRERVHNGGSVGEFEVQSFIRQRFADQGMLTDSGPIVAVNANAGNPHYEPSAEHNLPIRSGDFVLLDMWAKLDRPGALFYDITWTAFCGASAPRKFTEVFDVVKAGRDAAIARVQTAFATGADLRGFEVDDAARDVITAAGYGDQFTHRTGHSIGVEIHGNGANMDNLETHDERRVLPWSCFSIEPGVYLDDFGVRSEIDIFVRGQSAEVTGEMQTALLLLA